ALLFHRSASQRGLSRVLQRYADRFPLWALLGSAIAVVWPAPLAPLAPAVAPLLGVVMLGMGLTLSLQDFAAVVRRPLIVLAGVTLQFLAMPLLAWGVARVLGLEAALATGL